MSKPGRSGPSRFGRFGPINGNGLSREIAPTLSQFGVGVDDKNPELNYPWLNCSWITQDGESFHHAIPHLRTR
jgi:hypothetical protein